MYLVRLLEALLYLAGHRDPARTPPGCQGRLARRTFIINISPVLILSKTATGKYLMKKLPGEPSMPHVKRIWSTFLNHDARRVLDVGCGYGWFENIDLLM
jgi:hypothetical protein